MGDTVAILPELSFRQQVNDSFNFEALLSRRVPTCRAVSSLSAGPTHRYGEKVELRS